MDLKPRPNHFQYLQALARMTPEERLLKACELSALGTELFLTGLRNRFPEKSEQEIRKIYLDRITKCYDRNY
ncbi:MAG: hypothetical protein SH857_18865 [Chitinophagales bacterium]|nr:hypothetical protein [Chitinophagales bacterium]